jgi:hypothetical protein
VSLRYSDKGGAESYEVNSFPYGQTHVGFANLYFKGYSSDGREEIYGKFVWF